MKKYLADIATLLRVALLMPLVILSWQQQWELAFITLLVAWATDIVDGPLSRRYGSWSSSRQLDIDKATDALFSLGVVTTLIPTLYVFDQTMLRFYGVFLIGLGVGAVLLKKVPSEPIQVLYHTSLVGMPIVLYGYLACGWAIVPIAVGIAAIMILRYRKWYRQLWAGFFN